MSEVLIKFVADTSGLQDATDALNTLGNAPQQVADKFSILNQQINSSTGGLSDLNDGINSLGQNIAIKGFQQQWDDLKKSIDDANTKTKSFTDTTKGAGNGKDNIKALADSANAVGAAFSAAQNAATLFGVNNEALAQTITKVQSAMALANNLLTVANALQGEGAIKVAAYGESLTVVETIQEAFAVSSAAAWGIATAGVGLLVAGVTALVYWFSQSGNEAETASDKVTRLKGELDKQAESGSVDNDTLEEYKQALIEAGEQNAALEPAVKAANKELEKQRQSIEDIATFGKNKITTNQIFDDIKSGASLSGISITELKDALTELKKRTEDYTGLVNVNTGKPNIWKNELDDAKKTNTETKKAITLLQTYIDKLENKNNKGNRNPVKAETDSGSVDAQNNQAQPQNQQPANPNTTTDNTVPSGDPNAKKVQDNVDYYTQLKANNDGYNLYLLTTGQQTNEQFNANTIKTGNDLNDAKSKLYTTDETNQKKIKDEELKLEEQAGNTISYYNIV